MPADKKPGGFSDEELEGLTPEEREALEGDDDDTAALAEVAGADDEDDDELEDPAAKAAEDKAAAAAKEKEEAAERKATEEAEVKAKKELDDKAKAAADAAEKAAKEADAEASAEAIATARKEAEAKVRTDAKGASTEVVAAAGTEVEDEMGEELFVATYQAAPPENYDQRVKDIETKKAEVTAKFKKTEIELDEMMAEHAKLDRERQALDLQKAKADIAAEQNEQASAQRWHWEINRFMRESAKHDGVDYRVEAAQRALEEAQKGKDPAAVAKAGEQLRSARALNAALDAEVKALANDPANKERTGEWFLETAHAAVKKTFKIGKPATDATAAAAATKKAADAAALAKAQAERDKKSGKDKLAKTLSGLPAAGASETTDTDGEFAHLEALNGMDLEVAVAKLTPDQQERWARA